ncbi:MAG: ATP-binding protein, partial [Nostocaceae cyanobacterium]|nr:ATP-binding protein [Nostocaceae cyanobacterium]
MTSIDELIKREVNPFDLINLKPGNFWGEKQDSTLMVESIHQQELAEIEAELDLVAKDHRSRSLLLLGDSGSGKSYLLGRLKRTLNPKAFFAYIGPWADSEHIWRHVLRYTVDSLMQVPEGQQDSQLMLWLKSLSAFTKRNVKQRIAEDNFWEIFQTDRKKFIKHLKQTYKSASIYNPDIFFGVLHDLTNPELYDLACEWLRGDDLSDESMQELKVKHCIDSEDAAKTILSNFGRISTETQPIVLCFDNLDNIPTLPDGSQDFPALFNINTTIHNDYLKNFLVIISVITNTWIRNRDRIPQADRARIDKFIQLKTINLEQAEALWSYHLNPLHQQANPLPDSPIFPLNSDILEQNFPGGKTTPRATINQGKIEYQKYKLSLLEAKKTDVKPTPVIHKPTLPKGDIKQPTPDKKIPVIPSPLPLKNINQPPQIPTPTPQPQKDKSQAEFEL